MMRKFWRQFYFLVNRRRLERELAEEMAGHREMMPPDLRQTFGNVTRLREESKDQWSGVWLQQLWQDLFYGVRILRNSPAFTLGAIAVLALGIGVNLAEFQIFDALVFHRVDIRDANALLQFSRDAKQGERIGFPAGAVAFYRAESHCFAWLISEDPTMEVTVGDDLGIHSNLVPGGYFSSLGILPSWGRLLNTADDQPGASAVAVLSYSFWETHFGSDAHVIGRVLRINNAPVQIVGVAPFDFSGISARSTAIWLPLSTRPLLIAGAPPPRQDFSRATSALFGKLRTGVSQAAGEAELTLLTKELIRREPRNFRGEERILSHLVQKAFTARLVHTPAFAIFIVMILLVLFSACANLGNMLLVRGMARQREISIRLALGASSARMIRQLMTENLLLAILGSAAGVAFGAASARLLFWILDAPRNIRLPMSWPLLSAGCLLTFLSVIAFGLPAAFQTVRPAHRVMQLRQSLVGVQVAVSCLLLIASSVLAHNGILAASIHVAFDYPKMIVLDPQLYRQNLQPAEAQRALDMLTDRLRMLPGVEKISAASVPPFGGRFVMETLPGLPHIYRNAVAPSYFSLMNLPILRGRTFWPGEQNVVALSESAARAVWPNQNPIGKIWTFAGADRTVTGLVKDSGANLLADSESIEAYVPIQGTETERAVLILEAHNDLAHVMRMVCTAAAASGVTVSASLMSSSRESFIEGQQKTVTLIGSIGAVATTLAAAGMFALVAFAVARRKRELGIRIAVGAGPGHILAVLLRQNVKPMAAGALAGAILAALLTRLTRSLIFLQNHDPVDVTGFAVGLTCFALVATLATLSPVIRALRIDPSVTLRED